MSRALRRRYGHASRLEEAKVFVDKHAVTPSPRKLMASQEWSSTMPSREDALWLAKHAAKRMGQPHFVAQGQDAYFVTNYYPTGHASWWTVSPSGSVRKTRR